MGYATLREVNPRLLVVSITPFGQTGPYRHYQSSDLIAQAMGGFLYTTGRTDAPPMGTVLEQMAIVTARNAAIAIMAALLRQRLSGTGQHIDVSIMEAVVSTPPNFIHSGNQLRSRCPRQLFVFQCAAQPFQKAQLGC